MTLQNLKRQIFGRKVAQQLNIIDHYKTNRQ
jgi:hypothetical protein